MNAGRRDIPISAFFAKADRDQIQVSPNGQWLAWRARDPNTGVLNLWAQPSSTDASAYQVTFCTDRDICLLYRFSEDDRTLLYLREPKHGSEFYHLYAIDLEEGGEPRDLLGEHPELTCAVGFVGGVQWWTFGRERPREILVATSTGTLFWDVSCVNIDTGELKVVVRNPMSSILGKVRVGAGTAVSVLASKAMALFSLDYVVEPPRIPIQWFPDTSALKQVRKEDEINEELGNHLFRGRMEAGLGAELMGYWSVAPQNQESSENKWITLDCVPFDSLNMQLIGSGCGTGLARMDFVPSSSFVDLHTCRVKDDTTAYLRYDISASKEHEDAAVEPIQVLAQDSLCDISGFVEDPTTGGVSAVLLTHEKERMQEIQGGNGVSDTSFWRLAAFKKWIVQNSESLEKEDDAQVSLVSRSRDDSLWALHVQSDHDCDVCADTPSAYFLQQKKNLEGEIETERGSDFKDNLQSPTFLCAPFPRLATYRGQLGRMHPVHVPARDGEDILCYLSIPADFTWPTDTSTPLRHGRSRPLVVFPHGGPNHRDFWGFQPICQLFTSRGFLVLQPQYRGSTGFGTAFMQKGMQGAFATTMQTDIDDCVDWAIRSYGVDSARLAIVGASFGGYCVLSALTRKPERYRCGVSICGLAAVGAADDSPAFRKDPLVARYWRKVFGETIASDREEAKKVSPLFHAEKISRPVMLIQGANDPRVPQAHAENMAGGLEPGLVEYVLYEDEGHGITKEENILDCWKRVDMFLCKHLLGIEIN